MGVSDQEWRAANRANWDERVAIHLRAPLLRPRSRCAPGTVGSIRSRRPSSGRSRGGACSICSATSAATACRSGSAAAEVVGLDFSAAGDRGGARLADEIGLAGRRALRRGRSVRCAGRDRRSRRRFDLVFVTWGAIYWLPDIRRWAEIVAHFIKPGGALYLAEGHPAALVFDDLAPPHGNLPGWFAPYFLREPLVLDDPTDYADENARLQQCAQLFAGCTRSATIVTAPDRGRAHAALAARARRRAVAHVQAPGRGRGRPLRWPDEPWLPLAFSLRAERRGGARQVIGGPRLAAAPRNVKALRPMPDPYANIAAVDRAIRGTSGRGDGAARRRSRASARSLETYLAWVDAAPTRRRVARGRLRAGRRSPGCSPRRRRDRGSSSRVDPSTGVPRQRRASSQRRHTAT